MTTDDKKRDGREDEQPARADEAGYAAEFVDAEDNVPGEPEDEGAPG